MPHRPVTEKQAPDEHDVRAIEELFADIQAAFAEHDVVKFDARFTADVVFTAVNGRRFHGWEEIHAYHRERLEHHADDITTWYEIDHITFPEPTVALVFLRQPMVTPGGRRANIGTWVLVKRDGTWWFSAMQNTGIAQ